MDHGFIQDLPFKIDGVQKTELLFHHFDELRPGSLGRNIVDHIRPCGAAGRRKITLDLPAVIHQRGEEELGSPCTGLCEQ